MEYRNSCFMKKIAHSKENKLHESTKKEDAVKTDIFSCLCGVCPTGPVHPQ